MRNVLDRKARVAGRYTLAQLVIEAVVETVHAARARTGTNAGTMVGASGSVRVVLTAPAAAVRGARASFGVDIWSSGKKAFSTWLPQIQIVRFYDGGWVGELLARAPAAIPDTLEIN